MTEKRLDQRQIRIQGHPFAPCLRSAYDKDWNEERVESSFLSQD